MAAGTVNVEDIRRIQKQPVVFTKAQVATDALDTDDIKYLATNLSTQQIIDIFTSYANPDTPIEKSESFKTFFTAILTREEEAQTMYSGDGTGRDLLINGIDRLKQATLTISPTVPTATTLNPPPAAVLASATVAHATSAASSATTHHHPVISAQTIDATSAATTASPPPAAAIRNPDNTFSIATPPSPSAPPSTPSVLSATPPQANRIASIPIAPSTLASVAVSIIDLYNAIKTSEEQEKHAPARKHSEIKSSIKGYFVGIADRLAYITSASSNPADPIFTSYGQDSNDQILRSMAFIRKRLLEITTLLENNYSGRPELHNIFESPAYKETMSRLKKAELLTLSRAQRKAAAALSINGLTEEDLTSVLEAFDTLAVDTSSPHISVLTPKPGEKGHAMDFDIIYNPSTATAKMSAPTSTSSSGTKPSSDPIAHQDELAHRLSSSPTPTGNYEVTQLSVGNEGTFTLRIKKDASDGAKKAGYLAIIAATHALAKKNNGNVSIDLLPDDPKLFAETFLEFALKNPTTLKKCEFGEHVPPELEKKFAKAMAEHCVQKYEKGEVTKEQIEQIKNMLEGDAKDNFVNTVDTGVKKFDQTPTGKARIAEATKKATATTATPPTTTAQATTSAPTPPPANSGWLASIGKWLLRKTTGIDLGAPQMQGILSMLNGSSPGAGAGAMGIKPEEQRHIQEALEGTREEATLTPNEARVFQQVQAAALASRTSGSDSGPGPSGT